MRRSVHVALALVALTAGISLLSRCTAAKATTRMPSADQLAAAQKTWPEASMATLENGHSIYNGVCTDCHGAKRIQGRSETEWQAIIDDMSARAKLDEAQKKDLTIYILSARQSGCNC